MYGRIMPIAEQKSLMDEFAYIIAAEMAPSVDNINGIIFLIYGSEYLLFRD
jgi:hypothetical protein